MKTRLVEVSTIVRVDDISYIDSYSNDFPDECYIRFDHRGGWASKELLSHMLFPGE